MQKRRDVNLPGRALTEDTGLVACGSSGAWDVSLDQTLGRPSHYFLELDGPREYIRFRLMARQSAASIHDYLRRVEAVANVSDDGSLVVGIAGRSRIMLAWDDEHADRCFLIVGYGAHATVRITLLNDDVKAIAAALEQVVADMASPIA
jgi:hypothetical protein